MEPIAPSNAKCFDHSLELCRVALRHLLPVEGIERGEDLQHRQTAGGERGRRNRVAEIFTLIRCLFERMIVGEIFFGNDAAVLLELPRDLSRDYAAVERLDRSTIGQLL